MALEGEGGAGSEGGSSGNEEGFDLGAAMDAVVAERGDKLGSGEGLDADPAPADKPAPAGGPAPVPGGTTPPAGGTPAGTPPAPADPAATRRPPDLERAPASWKPEVATKWAGLDPEIRAEIHRREEDSARGVAEVRQVAEVGKSFQAAIAPYAAELRQYNIDPARHAANLMATHRTLALGTPEVKLQTLTRIAREMGIPLPTGAQTPAPGEEAWVDPQVKALQASVEQLKSTQETRDREAAETRRQALVGEVTAFFNDKTANPYVDEVADEMAVLINGSGGKMALKDAYDKAIWTVPSVREKLVAAQQQTAAKEAEEAEAKRAAEADRLKALNLRSRSRQVTDTGKTGTMDDTLKDTYAKLMAKEK